MFSPTKQNAGETVRQDMENDAHYQLQWAPVQVGTGTFAALSIWSVSEGFYHQRLFVVRSHM